MAFVAPFPGTNFVTGSWQAFAQGGSNQTTFNSISFGTAATGRWIALVIAGFNSAVPTSATIGGVSAQQFQLTSSSTHSQQLWGAIVPTGTSGQVVINYTGSPSPFVAFDLYAIYGASASNPTLGSAANGNPFSATLSLPSGCFVVAGAHCGGTGSYSWSGVTLDQQRNVSGASSSAASAQVSPAGLFSLGVTFPNSNFAMAVCEAWNP